MQACLSLTVYLLIRKANVKHLGFECLCHYSLCLGYQMSTGVWTSVIRSSQRVVQETHSSAAMHTGSILRDPFIKIYKTISLPLWKRLLLTLLRLPLVTAWKQKTDVLDVLQCLSAVSKTPKNPSFWQRLPFYM